MRNLVDEPAHREIREGCEGRSGASLPSHLHTKTTTAAWVALLCAYFFYASWPMRRSEPTHLFDLVADPHEMRNFVNEPTQREIREELRSALPR